MISLTELPERSFTDMGELREFLAGRWRDDAGVIWLGKELKGAARR